MMYWPFFIVGSAVALVATIATEDKEYGLVVYLSLMSVGSFLLGVARSIHETGKK